MLDLSGCLGFKEAGVAALASSIHNLKSLNLCGCTAAVTDKALQVCTHSCSCTLCHTSHDRKVWDNLWVQALAAGCTSLESLNLGWCERITDAGVVPLALGCRHLSIVDFCGCLLITVTSIQPTNAYISTNASEKLRRKLLHPLLKRCEDEEEEVIV